MSEYEGALRSDLAASLVGTQEVANALGLERHQVQALVRNRVLRPLTTIDHRPGRGGYYTSTPVFRLDDAREQYYSWKRDKGS